MFKAGGGGDVSSEEDSDPECPNIQVCSYFLVFLIDDLAYNIGTKEYKLLRTKKHSWAQRKLSPLNILLSINGPLISLGFNGLND